MRAFTISAFILSTILAAAASARSGDVPKLNIEPLCRGIANQSSNPMAENYPKYRSGIACKPKSKIVTPCKRSGLNLPRAISSIASRKQKPAENPVIQTL